MRAPHEYFVQSMVNNGIVRLEKTVLRGEHTSYSRGFYIVDKTNGICYLHHDGNVKEGVNSDSEKPAFWDNKEEAELFLEDWKKLVEKNV